jgi:hypothetical protein
MDLSAVNINLNALTGSNITIIIGIFVTLVVMGITTFYDKRKGEGKPLAKSSEFKPSFNLSQKIRISALNIRVIFLSIVKNSAI